eukprot:2753028-Pleurochrysis_carterae.AAC.1
MRICLGARALTHTSVCALRPCFDERLSSCGCMRERAGGVAGGTSWVARRSAALGWEGQGMRLACVKFVSGAWEIVVSGAVIFEEFRTISLAQRMQLWRRAGERTRSTRARALTHARTRAV